MSQEPKDSILLSISSFSWTILSNTRTEMATTMVAVAVVVLVLSLISQNHCKAASLSPSNLGNQTAAAGPWTQCNSLDEDIDMNTAFPSLAASNQFSGGTKYPNRPVCNRPGRRYDYYCPGPERGIHPQEKYSPFKRNFPR